MLDVITASLIICTAIIYYKKSDNFYQRLKNQNKNL